MQRHACGAGNEPVNRNKTPDNYSLQSPLPAIVVQERFIVELKQEMCNTDV